MEQAITSSLSVWESFYVIVGSASAALTGLQFIVIVLSAELNSSVNDSATGAFATPNIIHFSAVLFISALLSAPWPTLLGPSIVLGIGAIVGLSYATLVIRRMMRQRTYTPVLEDWVWHTILPPITYSSLLIGAFLLNPQPVPALFVIGAAALLLLFIGIHNAWDSVVYIALMSRTPANDADNND